MSEQWKPFADSYYEASDEGRIRRAKPGMNTWAGRIMKQAKNKRGYLFVGTNISGVKTIVYVHRIVAELFIGPCPPTREVHHKDGVQANNWAVNLEYISHRQNALYGLVGKSSRLVYSQSHVDLVRKLWADGKDLVTIAERTGIPRSYCGDIIKGRTRVRDWSRSDAATIEPIKENDISTEYRRRCKFPQSTIDRVRSLRDAGCSYQAIATKTGMSTNHACRIVNGKSRVVDRMEPSRE